MSISEMAVLDGYGLYKHWVKTLGEAELKKHCIIEMARHMFRRTIAQPENMERISGSHERANTVITNYLLERNCIAITNDVVNVDGDDYHLYGIEVTDYDKAYATIVELLQLVQHIKSTGDTIGCKELFAKYTTQPFTIEMARQCRQHLLQINKKLVGNVKVLASIYPNYQPILDSDGQLIGATLGADQNIFEQNQEYRRLMLSIDY